MEMSGGDLSMMDGSSPSLEPKSPSDRAPNDAVVPLRAGTNFYTPSQKLRAPPSKPQPAGSAGPSGESAVLNKSALLEFRNEQANKK